MAFGKSKGTHHMKEPRDHIKNARIVNETVRPVLNGLNSRQNIPVRDINAALFGMVTCSMQADIGEEQAREFIESAMDNVWGKKPFWKRVFK